jgi:hypothetical protein
MHETWGVVATEAEVRWCDETVHRFLQQVEHPLRKKYGTAVEVITQEQMAPLWREVAGTEWANVPLLDTPFDEIKRILGSWSFAPVKETGQLLNLLSSVAALAAAICSVASLLANGRPRIRSRNDKVGGMLDRFARLVGPETRKDVEASAADLRSEVRDMRRHLCGRWDIKVVRFWKTTTTIVPIVWDGCVRISKKLPVLGTAVRALSALLRKIDPPRLG